MAVKLHTTQGEGNFPHTKGEFILVADQNDYSYADFCEYMEKFANQSFKQILDNPKLIPYTPKFVKRQDLVGTGYSRPPLYQVSNYTIDNHFPGKTIKQVAFARSQFMYYVFGVESQYAYEFGYSVIAVNPDHTCKEFDHPITRKWFTGN